MPDLSQIKDTWRSIEPRGQITLVVSFLLIAVTGYFLFTYATQTSYTTLETGLNASTTNQITQALASSGVAYRVSAGGSEVDVPSSDLSAAQLALAAKGVEPGTQPGLSSFTKTSLGMTSAQQQAMYQLGLEGDIARQIEGIDGVDSAQVELVLPADTLFQDQASKASASVLVSDNGALPATAVAAIAHLVASGVQGLDPQNVTITDNTGTLLWPNAESGGSPTAASKLEAEQSYDSQLEGQIDATLMQALGPGKAEARVNSNLNVDQTSSDSVTYDGRKVPLQVQDSKEQLAGTGSLPGGAAGTAGNIPPTYTTGGKGRTGSSYLNQTGSTTYGADKTVSHTVQAPGTVQSLNVALLFDTSVPAKTQQALRQTVATMVGLTPSRGDTMSVATVPFQKVASASAPAAGPLAAVGVGTGIPGLVKYALAAIGSLVFLFLLRRNLRRREGERRYAEPTWLTEISRATPLAALEAGDVPPPPTSEAAQQRQRAQRQVEEIVHKSPEQVAMQVAQWMAEG